MFKDSKYFKFNRMSTISLDDHSLYKTTRKVTYCNKSKIQTSVWYFLSNSIIEWSNFNKSLPAELSIWFGIRREETKDFSFLIIEYPLST